MRRLPEVGCETESPEAGLMPTADGKGGLGGICVRLTWIYVLPRPAAGTPPGEEGQAAEQLVHHEGDPAAGEAEAEADAQQIGKQDAHRPGGEDGYHHGEHHISGSPQGVVLDMIEGTADLHEDVDEEDGRGHGENGRIIREQIQKRPAEKADQGGTGDIEQNGDAQILQVQPVGLVVFLPRPSAIR